MAGKMAERRSPPLSNQLGTILVLCALATCGTTEEHVVGWLGEAVRLPCDLTITPSDVLALYWTNSSDISKVSFFKQQPRSFDDRFTMNEDFSMVIRDVKVSDEGRYSCHVDLESGESFLSHTKLAVYAPISTPHIEQCVHEPTRNDINRHILCTVETTDTHPFNLECRVFGFRPNVTLEWTSSGIVKQPLGEPFQRELLDGTSEREVTISVTSKLDKDQNYTCTVRGEATNGTDRSATVTVLALPVAQTSDGLGIGGIVGITFAIIFLIIVLLIAILVSLYKKRRLQSREAESENKEIQKAIRSLNHIPLIRLHDPQTDVKLTQSEEPRALDEAERQRETLLKQERLKIKVFRDEIKKYTFKIPDGRAHIGMYGEMGAGKSAFMNSIEFAFNGKQSQPTVNTESTVGGHTKIRSCLNLTDHISLFDNRGMKDFSLSCVAQYMNEIRGNTEEEPSQSARLILEEIHCPVFVYKHGDCIKEAAAVAFVEEFTERLREYNGYSPMVVITHADSLSIDIKNDLRKTFSNITGGEQDVFAFENYTNYVENRQKSIRFLEFLKEALDRCNVTVVNIERRKKVKKPKEEKKKGWFAWIFGW